MDEMDLDVSVCFIPFPSSHCQSSEFKLHSKKIVTEEYLSTGRSALKTRLFADHLIKYCD